MLGCVGRRPPKILSELMRKSVDVYMVVLSATLHIEIMPCTSEMVARYRGSD
jgi:hypothetical protein